MAKKLNREQEQKKKAEQRRKDQAQALGKAWLLPLQRCTVSQAWFDTRDNLHLVHVSIARYFDERVLFGSFLIDLCGRGIKDAFIMMFPSAEAANAIFERPGAPVPVDVPYAFAAAVIQAGLRIGEMTRVPPCADFLKGVHLLEPDFRERNYGLAITLGGPGGMPLIRPDAD
ncbi:MAG: hypothetical protein RL095_3346 [Verrucomicrobiota bacterium]|jgi:hypothetical protein